MHSAEVTLTNHTCPLGLESGSKLNPSFPHFIDISLRQILLISEVGIFIIPPQICVKENSVSFTAVPTTSFLIMDGGCFFPIPINSPT